MEEFDVSDVAIKVEANECVVCLKCRISEYCDVTTSNTETGTPLYEFLYKYTQVDIANSPNYSKLICKTCFDLVDTLECAEIEYFKLKKAFEAIIKKNPLFECRVQSTYSDVLNTIEKESEQYTDNKSDENDSEDDPLALTKETRQSEPKSRNKKTTSTSKHKVHEDDGGRFVECGGSEAATPITQHPEFLPETILRDEDICAILNYGSEAESEDSDEEELYPAPINRRFLSSLDTPEDDAAASDTGILPTSTVSDDAATVSGLTGVGQLEHYDFIWTAFPDAPVAPEARREQFNSPVGPTIPSADPYATFVAIWDRQIMDQIALETNRYGQEVAQQMLNNNSLLPCGRIFKWNDTTADELYVYFGIILAMGNIVKSQYSEYWIATSNIFETPGFRAHMPLRRFQLLSRCLHFNSNQDMRARELDGSEAKLYKIQPLLDHLNNKFQNLYNLGQNIALDESLLQWKGSLDMNHFISNKAAAVGMKSYEICESRTGYLWRFEIHAHKRSSRQQPSQDPLDATTPSIVLRLIQGLEHKGHTLWMNNFYNSPALAKKLKSIGFDCVGTLRTNRQFVPEALSILTKSQMLVGQAMGFTSGDVDLLVFKDRNRVATISTYHGNARTLDNGTLKPNAILDYNVVMGGLDKKDQMLAMYPIERKRPRIWYKKLFRRLLNVSVLNSYIIVKSSSSSISHRDFRTSLILSLLQHHSSDFHHGQKFVTDKFLANHHYLAGNPMLPGKSGRQRRVCRVCKRRTTTYCVGCSKSACMTPCFVTLHT